MLAVVRGRASGRKFRLFACACCRRIWELLPEDYSRKTVEAAELFADGRFDARQMKAARMANLKPGEDVGCARTVGMIGIARIGSGPYAAYAAWWAAAPKPEKAARLSAENAALAGKCAALSENKAWSPEERDDVWEKELTGEAVLLREVFGNPFRPAVPQQRWLTPTVVKIAQQVDNERYFEDLPVLADALEDAGCDNADILSHCRGPGPHVRGCWVLDLILGKN
jgi:hypothetical protein